MSVCSAQAAHPANDQATPTASGQTAPLATDQAAPIAIVGIGALFPQAPHSGWFWANVKNGVDCITDVPPTHWNPADYFDPDPKRPDHTYARRGGFLSPVDFNPIEWGLPPKDLEATDTAQLLGLVAAKMALEDAGIRFHDASTPPQPGSIARDRAAVILGVTGTLELVVPLGARLGHPHWRRAMQQAGIPNAQAQQAIDAIAQAYVPWQENSFPGLLGNVVAGRIANKLDLHGTNCVVDAACASSLSAIHLAILELQTGKADVVVSGGVDTFNDIFMFMCFSKTPALSPTGDARPFDEQGDGTILGEGLGVVVLKRLADAVAAGDRIYAVIRGLGTSSDGKGHAIYAPSAEGQQRCLRDAYRRAAIDPATVELVEAHGTGTKVGDATEATALTEIFQQAPPASVALGSVKSQIGHTKAAAGAASLIKVALALYHKVLPPTLKVSRPVAPLQTPQSPFYVNTHMRPWLPRPDHPRRAALSAFGFGGSNFHAVLEEYAPQKTSPDWDGSIAIYALTGANAEELARQLDNLPTTWDDFARAAEISRQHFNHTAPARLILVARRQRTDPSKLAAADHQRLTSTSSSEQQTSDLSKLLTAARQRLLDNPHAARWSIPEGAHFGQGPARGKLAVLFPGQGSQKVGMLRELACCFPELLEELAAVESHLPGLAARIYPPTRFTAEQRRADDDALRATATAQPALGAVELGAWRVLTERFGLQADAFAGHSFGELTALAAAARIRPTDLHRLSQRRGQLMAAPRDGDPGSMLAVMAPAAEVQSLLRESQLPLVIANINAPVQCVLSGPTLEIEQAVDAFRARGIRTVRLPVAAAFHSPLVADAAEPFHAFLEQIPFEPGTAVVYANSTAAPYPADAAEARALLGRQLARPVEYMQMIQAMAQAGVRTFLEVGPGSVLTGLNEAILAPLPNAAEFTCLALDAASSTGMQNLATVLARLAAEGYHVRLFAWEAESRCRPQPPAARPGLTVPICGANYRAPHYNNKTKPAMDQDVLIGGANDRAPHPEVPIASSPPRPAETPKMPAPLDEAARQALAATQTALAVLQQLQAQTAELHKQFLDSQELAQRTLAQLVSQQAALAGLPLPTFPPIAAAPQQSAAVNNTAAFAAAPQQPAVVNSAASFAATPQPPLAAHHASAPHNAAAVTSASVATVQPSAAVHRPTPTAVPPAPSSPAALTPPTATQINGRSTAVPLAASAIAETLLRVVAEKTGYPPEMLDLDMSLDTDLGIDSIKRVEILAALQERFPNAPAVKPEHLGSLKTLQDVVAFLASQGLPAAPTPTTLAPPAARPAPAAAASPTLTTPAPSAAHPAAPIAAPSTPVPTAPLADVAAVLLQVVAEKTGYPPDMLDLEMSLDSDLGIDSIKRVEILSALQERFPNAPVVKPEHLGTLRTLQHVVDFLEGRVPGGGPSTVKVPILPLPNLPADTLPASPKSELPEPPVTQPVASIALHDALGAPPTTAVTPPTSVPAVTPAATPAPQAFNMSARDETAVERSIVQPVHLDSGTLRPRVPFSPDAEFWIIADDEPLAAELHKQLRTLRFQAHRHPWEAVAQPQPGPKLSGLLLLPPVPSGDRPINRLALQWIQAVGPRLRRGSAACILTITRLDGSFGLTGLPSDADPIPGGLAGLIKTLRHEWPEVAVKALDLNPVYSDAPAAAAAAICEEMLAAGPLEVGISPTHRCTLELARTVGRRSGNLMPLGTDDVVLVTGGGRGVTAETAIALAQTYQPTLILTGRTPAPTSPEPAWALGIQEETALKTAAAAAMPGSTPRQINDAVARLQAQREIRHTIDCIQAAGGRAHYFAVNVANGRAVADMLHQIKIKHGPITALIHGAGVLADRRIEQLTPEQFDHVFNTKVEGARNLLNLLSGEELKAVVLFGSTSGRFGRTGQAAYAAANETLNKIAQVEARRRPNARVVCINWGPWEGGMVTPALRKMFEAEGIGLIPLAEGTEFLIQELSAAGRAVEVVALGTRGRSGSASKSGFMLPPAGSGSLPVPTPNAAQAPAELSLAFDRTLDIRSHPLLRSHVLDGRAVLPLAIHLEWLAHAALHNNPGLIFHGVNDLRITHGVMVEEQAGATLRFFAGSPVKQDRLFAVPVEIRGRRRDGRETLHSRAQVILAADLPKAPAADPHPATQPYPHPLNEIYKYFLFHGPDLHGVESIEGMSETAFVGRAYPAPAPAEWFANPLRSAWVADPLVLDASFQMMILWSFAQHGAGSLPCFLGRYRQYRRAFPAGPVKVAIRIHRDNGSFARGDIDYLDADGSLIARVQDYECVIDPGLNQAFRRNQLAAPIHSR